MWTSCLFLALFVTVQGRAVNISNTWVLPEEGFPVFYRYFRDRISWYEADAVCQFHHANLVTVDTTAQYDAVRAYLKELDISSAVWVGLIRSNPDGDFTWTDYRGLSGEGYWSSAPDSRTAPLCAAADPAADYRWDARACGGPSVASFICELPVPQWALGNEGCMVKALPALTVLYLPESAAVQLTTDCGLAGVKRVQCTGNVKREDLLKDLSCAEEEQASSTLNIHFTNSDWQVTTDVSIDQDNDVMTEEAITTGHEDIEQASFIKSTPVHNYILGERNQFITKQYEPTTRNEKFININPVETNNLNNNIPSIMFKDDIASNEYADKLEDERHIQHKLLHDELARLGNLETIFNQPTDHFVPPLVMAKARLSNDMTAMSFEEKLAQEHDDYKDIKHPSSQVKNSVNVENDNTTNETPTTLANSVLISVTQSKSNNENNDKDYTKKAIPKKYTSKYAKYDDSKRKSISIINVKRSSNKSILSLAPSYTTVGTPISLSDTTEKGEKQEHNIQNETQILTDDNERDESSIELTVIIREPNDFGKQVVEDKSIYNETINIPATNTIINSTKYQQSATSPNVYVLHDEIINITFNIEHNNHSTDVQVMEVSTKMPIFRDNISKVQESKPTLEPLNKRPSNFSVDSDSTVTEINKNTSEFTEHSDISMTSLINTSDTSTNSDDDSHNFTASVQLMSDTHILNNSENTTGADTNDNNMTVPTIISDTSDIDIQHGDDNLSEEEIDDFQSPLLSGAVEPIHKPMRGRRPQNQNHAKKFNPFRILG
ncbi:putative uncharacterized protein DDB_G0277255 [Colias croceus]|uniref:putative uncharacterized protein DDB_G0277255 n=1 Tax=Colias crocea TaxID=72248 RepID=UPI001E27AA9F|nr:putative uncharacterized protein DDB_G0277255 [Colias croceus]